MKISYLLSGVSLKQNTICFKPISHDSTPLVFIEHQKIDFLYDKNMDIAQSTTKQKSKAFAISLVLLIIVVIVIVVIIVVTKNKQQNKSTPPANNTVVEDIPTEPVRTPTVSTPDELRRRLESLQATFANM